MVVFIPNKVGCTVTAKYWPEGYGNVFTSLAGGPGSAETDALMADYQWINFRALPGLIPSDG